MNKPARAKKSSLRAPSKPKFVIEVGARTTFSKLKPGMEVTAHTIGLAEYDWTDPVNPSPTLELKDVPLMFATSFTGVVLAVEDGEVTFLADKTKLEHVFDRRHLTRVEVTGQRSLKMLPASIEFTTTNGYDAATKRTLDFKPGVGVSHYMKIVNAEDLLALAASLGIGKTPRPLSAMRVGHETHEVEVKAAQSKVDSDLVKIGCWKLKRHEAERVLRWAVARLED